LDADFVAGGEGEIVWGDNAGAGEKIAAVREGILAGEPGGEFGEGALHAIEGSFATKNDGARAGDFDGNFSIGGERLPDDEAGAQCAAAAIDLGLREVERILAFDVAAAHVVGNGVAEDRAVGVDREGKFGFGDITV